MQEWRRQRVLVGVLTVALGVGAVIAIVRTAAFAARLIALASPVSDLRARAADADAFVRATDLASGLGLLVLAPLFVAWLWRAAKNQQSLGRRPERLGSGWAIGGWFIPLANLVIPVLVVQDLWRGSDPTIDRDDPRWRIADRSWVVGWWWGLWVIGGFGVSGARADQPGERNAVLEQTNVLALLGSASAAAAAVLAILVVRGVSARQEVCRRTQAEARASSELDRGAGAPFS